MKPVTMFVTSWCPHCKKALLLIQKIKSSHPEYENIEINVIDEEKNRALSKQYDYYFVPTFFVDGVKVHEGIPNEKKLLHVFEEAFK